MPIASASSLPLLESLRRPPPHLSQSNPAVLAEALEPEQEALAEGAKANHAASALLIPGRATIRDDLVAFPV